MKDVSGALGCVQRHPRYIAGDLSLTGFQRHFWSVLWSYMICQDVARDDSGAFQQVSVHDPQKRFIFRNNYLFDFFLVFVL